MPHEGEDPLGALRQTQELAVLAAFFCLLFFAAAKKSRCRPAQGQPRQTDNKTRMPATALEDQTKPKPKPKSRRTEKQTKKTQNTFTGTFTTNRYSILSGSE